MVVKDKDKNRKYVAKHRAMKVQKRKTMLCFQCFMYFKPSQETEGRKRN